MKLIEALNEIKSNGDYDDIMKIYARKEWNEDSETAPYEQTRSDKTDAGSGSKAIWRISNGLRSPSPRSKR